MAGSLNCVTLIGHVGKDPEIRATQDGRKIANLSLATSESWRDKASGEKKEKTEWHRIVIFNDGLVKVVEQYVKKGAKLYIQGSLQTRKWTDQAGVEKYSTEIVLKAFDGQIIMLDGRQNNDSRSGDGYDGYGSQSGGYGQSANKSASDIVKPPGGATTKTFDDEIPF